MWIGEIIFTMSNADGMLWIDEKNLYGIRTKERLHMDGEMPPEQGL